MKRVLTACLLLNALGACLSPAALAHVPRHLAGSQCRVLFFEDRVEISIDLGFRGSWAQAEMLEADSDRNSVVNKTEADAYLAQSWKNRIRRQETGGEGPAITCRVDGKKIELELVKSLHEGLVGQVAPTPFSLYFTVIARLGRTPMKTGSTHKVEITNRILEGAVPGLPLFLVPFSGHGLDPAKANLRHRLTVPGPEEQIIDAQGHRILIENRKLVAELSIEPPKSGMASVPPPLDVEINLQAPRPSALTENLFLSREEKESSFTIIYFFSSLLDQDLSEKDASGILGFLLLAFTLGAGHSLAPGHGKTMVAAYLAGSRYRYRDAILLGVTTTFTHTLTFIIIGATLLTIISNLAMGVLQERLITICMLFSGLLLTIMGLTIFLKRAGGEANDRDDESRDHSTHPDKRGSRLKELLGLGISSGLLPCTPGIMVILIGLHQPGKLFFSILLVLSFSLGVGFVLVLIGILTISGRQLLATHRRLAPLRRNLPGFSRAFSLVSALAILALGAFLLSRTVLSRPTEIGELFAWLRF